MHVPHSTKATTTRTFPVIDMEQLLDRLSGDLPLIRELAAAFIASMPTFLDNIRAAVRAGNASQASRAAHTLAGTLSNFAAEGPLRAVRQLERAALSGDVPALAEWLTAVEAQMDTLLPELVRLASGSSEGH